MSRMRQYESRTAMGGLLRSYREEELAGTGRKALRAYLFVSVKAEKLQDLTQQIADIPSVRMVETCRGVPDIFVVAEGEDAEEIKRLAIDKIQSLEGVKKIKTFPPLDERGSKQKKRERVAPRSLKNG